MGKGIEMDKCSVCYARITILFELAMEVFSVMTDEEWDDYYLHGICKLN
jgi:hypothetical protein